jgi:hypothetical protein
MRLRNYCITVLGKTLGIKEEVVNISENNPTMLEANGVNMLVFKSFAEPKELTDYFKDLDRNFVLFDTDESVSGYNLVNKDLHDALFSGIINEAKSELENLTNDIMDSISKSATEDSDVSGRTNNNFFQTTPEVDVKLNTVRVKSKVRVNRGYYEDMSNLDRAHIMNDLLENKPTDELTDYDKEVLSIIAELNSKNK